MLRRARALALILLALLASGLQADNTTVLNLPNLPPARMGKVPTPWRIQIDPSGIDGQAYRGVKITVKEWTNTPVMANHSLRVVVRTNNYGMGSYDEQVTAFIEVPEGAASTTTIVDVPQRTMWNAIHLDFYEDGEQLEGYSATTGLPRMAYRAFGDDSTGVLVIDSDAPTRDEYRALMATITAPGPNIKDQHRLPDIRWLVGAIPGNITASNNQQLFYVQGTFDDAQTLQTFASHQGVDLVPPKELSESWLSHSNADLIVVTCDDLQLLHDQQPQAREALVQWTMAGGTLLVYGCGDKWERVPTVSKLVDLPAGLLPPDASRSSWKLPNPSDFQPTVRGVFDQNQGGYTYSTVNPDGSVTTTPGRPPGPGVTWQQPPFALHRLGLGRVVAYRAENPFPGVPADWGGLWNTIGATQFLWSRRHGMSHQRQNGDFWNFVIPGVGEAPVFSFMTMIALFMLLIGPVNYYYLNRWRRLSLLLVTVPLGAGLFTLGLFLFAIVSDGFTTRARVRSFTVLEPSGRAASISRQTYYTAFVPSSGMNYPADTAVYPLHYAPYNESVMGHFYQTDSQWLDSKLQLQKRYLQARQHRQFVTVRSSQSKAKLEVTKAGSGLTVKNLLGTRIEYGLLVDDAGRVHAVENVEPNALTAALAIDPPAARRELSNRLSAKAPRLPLNFDPDRYNNMWSRQRYYGGWGGNSPWNPSQAGGMLETGIQGVDAMLMRTQSAPQSQLLLPGHERMFAAITADSVVADDGEALAPVGIAGSRMIESLHVVQGKW